MPSMTATASEGRAPHVRRGMSMWALAALAVIGGIAVGRFVVAGDSGSGPGSRGAVAVTAGPGADIAVLEGAVETRPDDPSLLRRLGTAYVIEAIRVGDPAFYGLAQQAFDRASEIAPGDPTLLVARGSLELSLHRFPEAEVLGRQGTAALPGNADALGVLVDAQVELGQYDDAAETLQAMLDARPGLPALARASYQRELRGDLEGAEQAMRQAAVAGAASSFNVASVTSLLGDLQRAQGDLVGAAASYEEALRLSPGLVQAELGRAFVLAADDDVDEAIAVVETVTGRFPVPAALTLLAELQHVAGDEAGERDTVDLVRVTAQLQQAAGQIVDLELSLFEADNTGEAGDAGRAVALGRASYEVRPDNIFAADALAWALLQAGEIEEAVPLAEQAVRLGTANPALRYRVAEVFAAAGDEARAAENLEAAYLAGPDFSVRYAEPAARLAKRLGVAVPEAP